MAHFLEDYAERVTDILHDALGGTLFYKVELVEVPRLLSAVLITYDNVRDDTREIRGLLSWEAFLAQMTASVNHIRCCGVRQRPARPTGNVPDGNGPHT